jgi:hypothetical protein
VVFAGVLFTPVLWFGALSTAYRYRLLDPVLGLDELPATRAPRGR